MIDILLTHAYFLRQDPAEQRTMKPYVPLGMLAISAWLKQHSLAVHVFDSTFSDLESFRRTAAELRPRCVGIYVTLMTKPAALDMVRVSNALGIPVILGGPEPAAYAAEYLGNGADVVVIGEGEHSLLELITAYREVRGKEPDLGRIDGIVFRRPDGDVVRTSARPLIGNIDTLPFPDRDAVDMKPYLEAWRRKHGYTSLSINTMRGCPYTCTWCSHAVYGESYRRRSPWHVAEEIERVREAYHPEHLWFVDDVFTINHRWILELDQALQARNLLIPFECITRADRLDKEIVSALARMHCRRIWIGAESGSQSILDAMRRGITVAQAEQAIALCRDAGIETGTFIMLGYDGESIRDIRETASYLRRARPDIVLSTTAYPIKGTPYHEAMNAHLAYPQLSFSGWTDRDILLTNRPPSRFYWFAHRYVMNEAARARPGRRARRFIHGVKAVLAHAAMLLWSRRPA